MSKSKNLIIGLSLLSISSAYVASCSAPGSSKPIQKVDPKIDLGSQKNKEQPIAPVISNPNTSTSSAPVPESRSSWWSWLFSNPVDSNAAKTVLSKLIKAQDKINYVAFGDSITAGFDGTLPADYQGEKNQNGAITGLSYPAFLARLLNNQNRVNEFKNFAHSGASILDWLDFLGVDHQNQNKSHAFRNIYGNNYNDALKDFKDRLSRANLVTFTLGANDLFELVAKNIQDYNLSDIFKTLLSSSPSYGTLVSFVNDVLGKSLSVINQRLNTLIANIKVLAPNANINIIAYPTPLLGIKESFDQYFKSLFRFLPIISIKPLDYLIGVLNSGLKSSAKTGSINYINLYNSTYWTDNATNLSTILFDIHPNTLGYKKMAMDLYLKLTVEKFGVSNYQNYDFNKDFLNSDSDTLEYQIQTTQNPNQVLGTSTQDYLSNISSFETQMQPYRDERNFGKRVGDLVNIFGDLLTTKGIQDSIYNLQVQLRNLKESNQLSLSAIPTLIASTFLNEVNIVKLVSTLSKSEVIRDNKERITQIFNSILENGLNAYKGSIAELLSNKLLQATQNKLKESSVKSIVNKILADQNFEKFLKTLSNIFISHPENFEAVQSYKDILLAFLKNNEDFENLSDSFSSIAGYVFENSQIQDLFADIFYQYLVDNQLNSNISSDQSKKFTKDILTFASDSLLKDNLLKDTIKGILDDLKTNPNTNITSVLKSAFGNVFDSLFKFTDDNSKLISLLKKLLSSDLISQNKNLIKQLISNILNSDQGISVGIVSKFIPKNVAEQLYQYGGKENVASLIKYLFDLNPTKEIINNITSVFVENYKSYADFQTFNDLIQKILASVNLDQIKSNVNLIVNDLLSSQQFAQIINNLLLNTLATLGLNSQDSKVSQFTDEVSKSLKSLVDYLGVKEEIINLVFDKFKQIQTNGNSLDVLSNIPSQIFEIISNKVNQDTFGFVKGLVKLPVINSVNFKEVFAQLTDKIWDKLNLASSISQPLISTLEPQFTNPNISKYVDKDEIIVFIENLVQTNGFKNVIVSSIDLIIQNPIWETDVNNFKDLFVGLLKDKNLKSIFKSSLSQLIDDTLSTTSLEKSFAKFVNALLERYQVSLSDDNLAPLGTEFTGFLKEVLNQNDLKENILDEIFEALANSQNLQNISSVILDNVVKALNLNSSSTFISSILASEFVASKKENIKTLFEEFLTKLSASNQKGVFLEDLGLSSLVAKNVLTSEELNTLAQFIFSSNSLMSVIKKIFNNAIDNGKELASSNTYIEILDNLTYKQPYLLELKQPLIDLLNQNLENELIKKIISKSLHNFLVKESLDTGLTLDQSTKVVSDLISFVKNNSLITSLISNFINEFVDNAYNGTLSQINEILSRSLNSAFETTFDFSKDGGVQRVLSLFNQLTNSDFFAQNKDYFKTLLNNIVEKLPQLNAGSLLIKLLPGQTQEFIASSITLEKFNPLMNLVIGLGDTKNILKELINNVLDSYQSLQNVTSFNDLVLKAIKTINFDNIKTNAKNLLSTLIAQAEFKPLLKSIFSELYKSLKLNPEESHNAKFIEDLSSDFKTIIDQFQLLDPLLDKVFEKLSQASKSNQPLEVLKTLPGDLGTIFAQKVTNNPKEFISKVFNLAIFNINKSALSDLVKAIYGIAQQNEIFENLIKARVIPLLLQAPASEYVDAEEIGDLLLNLFKSDGLKNFIFSSIDLLLNNQDWLNHLDSPKALINSILKIPSFTNQTKASFAPLLKEVISNNKIKETLAKLSHKFASENGFNFETKKLSIVAKNALRSIIPYLESLGVLQSLIDNIFGVIEQQKDVDLIISNLPSAINSTFDFSNFKFVKHLLASDLFTQNQNILKEILSSFVDQFTTKNQYSQLVDQLNINNLVSNLNLSQQKITNLNNFIKEILKDANFSNIVKAIIPYFVDQAQNLSQTNSYNELAIAVVKNDQLIPLVKQQLSTLIKKALQNSDVQSILATFANNALNSSSYNWIFNGIQNPEDLFKNLFALSEQLESEFNILEKFFQVALAFTQDQQANSLNDFVNKLVKEFSNLFNSENIEQNAIKLVGLTTNLLPANETKLSKIVENILDKAKDSSDFINQLISFIPAEIQEKITPYVSKDNLGYLVQKLFSLSKFKEFVLDGFSSTIRSKEQIKQASSFSDLVKLVLSKLDLANKGKSAFEELITTFNADTKLKEIVKLALSKVLSEQFNFVSSTQLTNFSSDISDHIITLLQNLGVYDLSITTLFNSLSTFISSSNPDLKTQVINQLLEVVTNKFKENPQSFINNIVSSQIFSNNKATIKAILVFVAKKLITQETIQSLLEKEINSLSEQEAKYLDKDTLKELLKEILSLENLEQLLQFSINYLVENTSWVNNVSDINALIFKFIKDSHILSTQKTQLSILTNKILDSDKLNKLIQKAINVFLKEQGYSQEINLQLASGIKNFIQEFNEKDSQRTLIDKLLSLLEQKVQASDSLSQAFGEFSSSLVSTLQLGNFNLTKALIDSTLLKGSNKQEVKNILKFFFNKYHTTENVDKLLSLVPFDSIAQATGDTKEHIKTLLSTILNNNNIRLIADKTITFIVDNVEIFANASSYSDLVKIAFAQQSFIASIKQNFIDLLNVIVKNQQSKTLLSQLISSALNNSKIQNFLTRITDKNRLVNNLLEVFDIFDEQLGIGSILYESAVHFLKENGLAFENIGGLINYIFEGLKNSFGENTESKVAALVRSLSHSKLLNSNKDDLLAIFDNVFKNMQSDNFANLVENSLSDTFKDQINKYLSSQSFKELIKFIHSNAHFKELLIAVLRNSLNKFNEYASVQSYSDIAHKTLEIINVQGLENSLKGLISDLLTTSQVQTILHDFLKTTLKTYQTDVDDAQIQSFLQTLSSNFAQLIEAINLANPILEKVFEIIKSNNFITNPTQEISKIKPAISGIFKTTVSSDPKTFVDKILALEFIQSNKEGLAKTLTQLAKGLNTQGVIANFIKQSVEALDISNEVFKYVSKEQINALIEAILKTPQFSSLLETTVPELIKDTSWLNTLNNPLKMIFDIIKKPAIFNELQKQGKGFVETLLKDNALQNAVTNSLSYVFDTYNITLNNFNKADFIKQSLDNLVDILKSANLFDQLYENVFNTLNTSTSFNEFASQIPAQLTKILSTSHFDFVKALLNSTYVENQKEQLKNLIDSLMYWSSTKSDQIHSFLSALNLEPTLSKYQLSVNDVTNAISQIFGLAPVKNVLSSLVHHTLDNAKSISNASSYNDLVKNTFADSTFNTSIKENVKLSLSSLLSNDLIKDFVAKIVVKNLKDNNLAWLFDSIENPQELVKILFDTVEKLDEEFDLFSGIIYQGIDLLQSQGFMGDFSSILTNLANKIKTLLTEGNIESNLLRVIKTLLKSQAFQQADDQDFDYLDDVKQLFKNIFDYAVENVDFGNIIWNSLSQNTQQWIEKNLFSHTSLIELTNSALKSDEISQIINDIFAFILNNPQNVQKASNLNDVLKKYFDIQINVSYVKTRLTDVMVRTLSNPHFAQALKVAATKFFNFIEVPITKEITQLISLLENDLVPLANKIGLIDQVSQGLIKLIKNEQGSILEVLPKLGNQIFASVQLTNYNVFKKFIGDDIVSNNQSIIKNALDKIIESFVYRDGKLESILNSLKIGSSIVSYDGTTINNMLINAARNTNIMNVIKMLTASFVQNNKAYEQFNSWPEALNYFIKNANEQNIKNNLKVWFDEIAGQSNSYLAQGFGAILHNLFKSAGYNFDNNADLSMMKQIANGILKTLVYDSAMMNEIIFKIIHNIRSIDFTRVIEPREAFSKAILSGALAPLLSDDGENILTSKLFDLTKLINRLTDNIGADTYTRFINRLFESSSLEDVTGIYHFLNGLLELDIQPKHHNASNLNPSFRNGRLDPEYKWNKPFAPNVKFDSYNIFKIKAIVSDFTSTFFRPIFMKIYADAAQNKWNINSFKVNDGYKALFRMHTLLLWIIHDKANLGFLFWNGTWDNVEAYIAFGQEKAWSAAYNKYKHQISSNDRILRSLGTHSGGWWNGYAKTFWRIYTSGNDQNSTNNGNYYDDQVLAYIYFRKSNPQDRHNPSKTKTKVLLESLEQGYIGSPTRVKE
ncbi:SGNH/GDSL hydrolase family protein [Mycoplasmopsis citelli]|uniref:SGNH/GDSL hydrolase family protein n=1 Tax=Mycoplasmopsis citelli TaxID=171281 RepID=UPI0021145398|nr:SGNH/GDSL hydrolase family protein [Mycoplasmopsis citelli]UUD36428.1 SGNH/GDSL hydrolase family protein [Mycoplasmopsis citelli]